MHPDDREKTAFITDRGTYCYKVIQFGLKNAGATCQRLVNRMFADKLGNMMEVYIDDMLVKSLRAVDHLSHLKECFKKKTCIIMGGAPPCGDSVRSVKDHRLQAVTSKKWPSKHENDPQITFSPDDAIGVHLPHNYPLLVEVGIAKCDVAKVLVDTGSSVDLIFRDTLDKMGVGLRDMKPSSCSLTTLNGASEIMIATIKLPVYAAE